MFIASACKVFYVYCLCHVRGGRAVQCKRGQKYVLGRTNYFVVDELVVEDVMKLDECDFSD